jgi:hypothetical protein
MDIDVRQFLEDAASRDSQNLVKISIRELLQRWGHKRRGYWVVSRIEEALEEVGLVTEPAFTQGWIDASITLIPKTLTPPLEAPPGSGAATAASRDDGEVEPGEVTIIVGSLRSAGQGITSVPLDATLVQAQSQMMSLDFSQLGVMSDARTIRGAVTWESIAQAGMRTSTPSVRECLIPAEVVRYEDDLIHHIPRIVQAGYVFVQAKDRTITGIVTTADLSEEFARLASPFFLIGEIERRLRRAVDRTFAPEELGQVRDPGDETRDVASAGDLTIGEYVRLLEYPEHWERTGWQVDRRIFMGDLNRIRELRNEVMHFSPDPLEEEQINELRRFIRWLKILDP